MNSEEINKTIIDNIPVRVSKHRCNPKPYMGLKKQYVLPTPEKLRALFKIKPKQTIEKIIGRDKRITSGPKIEEICQTFTNDPVFIESQHILDLCTTAEIGLDLEPIEAETIVNKIKTLSNSTPGPDNINYSHLKILDPDGKLLSLFYNQIIKSRKCPSGWRQFRTSLIPKPNKADYEQVSNWRPIALSNSSYKVFTAILTDRLLQWVSHFKILHPGQKGSLEFEGCGIGTFPVDLDLTQDILDWEWLEDDQRGERREKSAAHQDLSLRSR